MSVKIDYELVHRVLTQDRIRFIGWGAKNFSYSENALNFKVGSIKINDKLYRQKLYVSIIYDYNSDLFNIEFITVRKWERIILKKLDGLYLEDLPTIIDKYCY